MKVTIIPVVIGALGTVTKGLVKGVEELEIRTRVKTIQAILRSDRIPKEVLEICGDLLTLKFQLKTICLYWCKKNLKGVKLCGI